MANITITPSEEDPSSLFQQSKLLIEALKNLQKAYDKFLGGKPSPREAKVKVDMYFGEVMRLLRNRAFNEAINTALSDLPTDQNEQIDYLSGLPSNFINYEIESVLPMRFSREDIIGIIRQFLRSQNLRSITNANDFYRYIETAHATGIEAISNSRSLSRKEKSKQKRKMAEGLFGMTAGVTLAIGNLAGGTGAAIASIAFFPSLMLGINRLINGYNTIVDSGS